MAAFTIADIPSQVGKLAVITGATGGLGYETALALAGAGGEVILTGRNKAKGAEALARVQASHPNATAYFEPLDLADLSAIAAFSARLCAGHSSLEILINNAGVMAPPTRQTTADGFELQLGVNYLGHFALTARLAPLLRQAQAPRIVNLSSLAHRLAAIHFYDLQGERVYRPFAAYGQSKLAMLMFALELQRRSDASGWRLMSNAAHPGYARTELIANGPGAGDRVGALIRLLIEPGLSQPASAGALPTLFAATSPKARGGGYYGPDGFYELKGAPGPARIARQAHDRAVAARLWEASETLTGIRLPISSSLS